MAEFNAVNRGVYIADNLDFLRRLNTECIDLVCIDPPFAKNETFTADQIRPPLTPQERDLETTLLQSWGIADETAAAEAGIAWPGNDKIRGGYGDIWSWAADIHEDWMVELETRYEGIHKLIEATRYVRSDSIAAYLCYMAIRLIELRRVIKPTGSLFLHCDRTANGYLRPLLDAIFGDGGDDGEKPGFRNEILWERAAGRAKGSQHAPRKLGTDTDTILWYAKGSKPVFNGLYRPPQEAELKALFPYEDERGRYHTRVPLFCQPSMGARPNLCYEYNGVRNPHPSGWRVSRARLAEMDARGEIIWREGQRPLRKSYAADYKGKPIGTLWDDIPNLTSAKERTGYPTQKPVALAERIIQSCANPGAVVLDCFAGCAYTAVAAERLGRRWVACDLNPRAWTVFKRQVSKPELILLTCNDQTVGQQVQGNRPEAAVYGPHQLPIRTSPLTPAGTNPLRLGKIRPAAPTYKRESAILADREMLDRLLNLSDYKAWCCGLANRRPDGAIRQTTDNFHLDHIRPKSKGGSDRIYNRAPLCAKHNTSKGNREIDLEKLRVEIAMRGEMLVDTPADLIDLDWAYERAMEIWALEYTRHHAAQTGPG